MSDPTANPAQIEPPRPTWGETLRVYSEPATLRMLFLGFSAGLPLLLVLGTLSFRLREAGVDRTTIGFLSWVGLAYGVKWIWAPLVDRVRLPLLTRWMGQRRSWLLLAQLLIMAGLVGMAMVDPKAALDPIVWFAVMVAFASATQDIALDAFRIESAGTERQGALGARLLHQLAILLCRGLFQFGGGNQAAQARTLADVDLGERGSGGRGPGREQEGAPAHPRRRLGITELAHAQIIRKNNTHHVRPHREPGSDRTSSPDLG